MKQPLMLAPTLIPPAQAEALYDTLLENTAEYDAPPGYAIWPGEDWEDELPAPSARLTTQRPAKS